VSFNHATEFTGQLAEELLLLLLVKGLHFLMLQVTDLK
jgi:hypothetical protein